MATIAELLADEQRRLREFPVASNEVFMGHGGVTALPAAVSGAMQDYLQQSSEHMQEWGDFVQVVEQTRSICAEVIGAKPNEIALLGPTALGLSLFANGLDWQAGDEVICYKSDYPSNVYPWMDLERQGVKVIYLEPELPGHITPQLVEAALTEKTKLVALASCHFLTGYRIQIDEIGKMLHEHGVLFSLDAIQTIGAFETRVDHVDFLSADAHKWMLGPMAIGIVYVAEEHFERLRPSLLGAWNVESPQFRTQEKIIFEEGARRYEPGVLNAVGVHGLKACLELLQNYGGKDLSEISARLLELKAYFVKGLQERGMEVLPPSSGENCSSITTFRPRKESDAEANLEKVFLRLSEQNISLSLRHDLEGNSCLRASPHFYNTEAEVDQVLENL